MTVHLHLLDPALTTGDVDLLDANERLRAVSFRYEQDRTIWAACRTALRRIIARHLSIEASQVPLRLDPNGKPYLAPPYGGLHFNLSHCKGLMLVALAPRPVGVDIEASDRADELLECGESFLHPSEMAALSSHPKERASAMLDIWTAKEAVLKAHGTGLLLSPDTFAVDLSSHPAAVLHASSLAQQRIHRLEHHELISHRAWLASSFPISEIQYHPGI